MHFFELLEGVDGARIARHPARDIREARDDSRRVGKGDLFVAIPGTKVDGSTFIADALQKGAGAILVEEGQAVPEIPEEVALAVVPSARKALGILAANRYDTRTLPLLTAVTGTNGKTTTTYLLESIFSAAGRRPGVIGTVGYRFGGRQREAALTTPGALELHAFLAEINQGRGTDAIMEASSIALHQGRIHGCRFRAAALTNVTQDHLDYHGTMEAYFAAKTILFRELLDGTGVVFIDDEFGKAMAAECKGKVLTLTRGSSKADVAVLEKQFLPSGIRARLLTPSGPPDIVSPLVGDLHLSNILTAVGLAIAHDLPKDAIATGLSRLRGVPGRLQTVANEVGVLCVVDYAHTPDALIRALEVLRPLCRGRLICVFGCGGDRDRGKRPLMGEAAAKRADISIVTSDNPRSEDPRAIVDMILAGIAPTAVPERTAAELSDGAKGYHVEIDRHTAISRAVSLSRMGDVILIAGKGHEDYQIIGTEKIHFDDREIASASFAARRRA